MSVVVLSLPTRHARRVNNKELVSRYTAGETLRELAAAAGMSLGGLQERLRRLGVPTRRRTEGARALTREQIAEALSAHGSMSAAARALGVGRAALTAQAHRYGLRPAPPFPRDLAKRYQGGATIAELAQHYDVGTTTVTLWLDAAGVPRRRPGRQPRDG